MPVYDKPMIYYPLSTLMLAGIRDILIISTPEDLPRFENLLGSGSQLGMRFSYAEQPKPEGLAQAFIIGAEFIGSDSVALALGDNILYGQGLAKQLQSLGAKTHGASVFGYYVNDPERYGVVQFNERQQITDIVEKPKTFVSNYAVPGFYFYDNRVVDIAHGLKPSPRGELEITDINRTYLRDRSLHVEVLGRGVAWLDTGTHESLLAASNFIAVLEQRQGLRVGCIEEIAYRMDFINRAQLQTLATQLARTDYGAYLQLLTNDTAVALAGP
jgi:glucose-1-phosphate thymidylyltransferase